MPFVSEVRLARFLHSNQDMVLSVYRLRGILLNILREENKNHINHMKMIFSAVKPKHHRILFCYDQNESLLYQAAERGLENVVELLVELGANIEIGLYLSQWNFTPLYIAVRNGNMPMVKLLVNLGANVNATAYSGCTLVNLACEQGHITVAEFLMSKGVEIYNNIHVSRAGHCMNYLFVSVILGCDINYIDDTRRNSLFYAVSRLNCSIISYLIKHGIDIYQKDDEGENALNIALHTDNTELKDYLKSFYSPEEVVKTYEIHGAKQAVQQCFPEAFFYWCEAFALRKRYYLPIKDPGSYTLGKYRLIISVDELSDKRFDSEYMMFQALNIFLRLLFPFHQVSRKTTMKIHEMFPNDAYVANELLMYIFRQNWHCPDPLSTQLHTLFLRIISSYSQKKFEFKRALKQIHSYMDFIEESVWPKLLELKNNTSSELDKYATITMNLMKFVHVLMGSDAPTEIKSSLVARLRKIITRETSRNLPTTLLHQATEQKDLLSMKVLVQCGADLNALDYRNNTPLHVGMSVDEPDDNITNFLVKYGCDVDAVNSDQQDLHKTLVAKGALKNNLDKISLKCLAAKVLFKNKIIVYEDECPQYVISIIKRHGGVVKVR